MGEKFAFFRWRVLMLAKWGIRSDRHRPLDHWPLSVGWRGAEHKDGR